MTLKVYCVSLVLMTKECLKPALGIVFICFIIGNCSPATLEAAPFSLAAHAESRVVEGQSIGPIKLGQQLEAVSAILGKTDRGDASMGRLTFSWFVQPSEQGSRGNWLDVFFLRDEDGHRYFVKEIHTNLSRFKTADGISIGSSLDSITHYYPNIHFINPPSMDSSISVYDSVERGIAFEMDKDKKCSGIILHKPGVAVTQMDPFGSISPSGSE
jgi:hypothetical protein